jgi:hypothetical protein
VGIMLLITNSRCIVVSPCSMWHYTSLNIIVVHDNHVDMFLPRSPINNNVFNPPGTLKANINLQSEQNTYSVVLYQTNNYENSVPEVFGEVVYTHTVIFWEMREQRFQLLTLPLRSELMCWE